jgi:hypothetical protein
VSETLQERTWAFDLLDKVDPRERFSPAEANAFVRGALAARAERDEALEQRDQARAERDHARNLACLYEEKLALLRRRGPTARDHHV